MGEWISVKDRLPKNEEKILILSRSNPEKAVYFRNEFCDMDIVGVWQDVTHWMSLPELS